MAEFVLSKLAESVLAQTVQRISDLLIYEAASLTSVRDDVVLLEVELRSLQGFLKEADSKQEQDRRLRDLLIQVREVASDAEDVVDTFIFKVSSSYIKASHNKMIRAQIKSIRNRIKVIFRSMQIFEIKFVHGEGTSSSMVEVQRNLRRSFPDDEDSDVISLEGSKTALTAQLMEEEGRLCIVSVVGMGGLGASESDEEVELSDSTLRALDYLEKVDRVRFKQRMSNRGCQATCQVQSQAPDIKRKTAAANPRMTGAMSGAMSGA